MDLINIALLLIATVNFILAIVIFLRAKKNFSSLLFALAIMFIESWIIGMFAYRYSDSQSSLFWTRFLYIAPTFIPTALLVFFQIFPSKKSKPLGLFAWFVICFNLLVVYLVVFTNSIIQSVAIPAIGEKKITFGKIYFLYVVYFNFSFSSAYLILIKKFRKSTGYLRNQVQYIFLGTFVSTVIAFSTNLFLPWFEYFELNWVGQIAIFNLVAFTTYAIIKHRLMDIRLLVLKSVAYSLTLLLLSISYVSIFYFGIERLNRLEIINPTFVNIVILLALAFSFNPLRRFIAHHTDRLFFKGYYNFNDLLAQLGDVAKKNSRSITGLTTKVMQTLTKEMRIDKAAFVLTNSPTLANIRTLGFESKSKTLWDKPTKLATQASEAIVYDELEEDSKEKEILRKADIQVLIPIKTEQTTEAILALGEKKSGDMYTSQDLNLLELVAPQIALALENAKSFKEKEQRIAELKSINKMFHHIEHFLDLDNLLQEIVDEAIKVTEAEGGSLMLLNKGGKTLSIKTARNLHPLISLNTRIKVGEGLAGTVAKTHEPLILNGLRDKKFRPYLKREDIVSAISVPMKTGDRLVGVLNVNRKKLRVEFSEENLNVMTAFASQAAEAIVKAGYYHKIEKLSVKNDNQFKEFTKALAKTVDAKDPYTYGHSEAVTGYALEIAQEMGLSEAQLRVIEIGGRLHDMGKIGISERILNKPGSLTDEEFTAIKRHPEIGADILKDTHYLKGIKELILYHHERFDGHGYPTGLKGKDIPLGARILAVADTYDAMTSHRAYRPALSQKIAVAEIVKCSGSQFDPDVAKIFLKILDRKKLRVIKNTTHQATYIAEAKAKRLDKKAE